jgi:hypothetical protein
MGLRDIVEEFHAPKPEPKPEVEEPPYRIDEELWRYLHRLGDNKDPSRRPGYHPSQMYGFCVRKEVLSHYFKKPEADYISPDVHLIFDWGTAWHWMAQNYHFGPMGILWGKWVCNGCAKVVEEGFMPEPCEECYPEHGPEGRIGKIIMGVDAPKRGGFWTYHEPKLYNEEFNIPGHADGILKLSKNPKGESTLLEIKTINGRRFKMLSAPDESYVFQMNIYLWLLGLKRGWLVYYTKDAKQEKPKVFRVSYDPDIIEEVKRRITLHKRAWPEKRLTRGICMSRIDPRAKYCEWVNECFSDGIEETVEQMREATA